MEEAPSSPPPLPVKVPGSWDLKASEIYTLPFYTSPSRSGEGQVNLPAVATHDGDEFLISDPFHGGLGSLQIIRYTSSPVGPYDEMLFVPGFFSCPAPRPRFLLESDSESNSDSEAETDAGEEDALVTRREEEMSERNARITRIYVSSRESVFNGRRNWNIPKHLAAFTFDPVPGTNATKITVTPQGSTKPLFTATYKPISLPFPFSLLPYLPVRTSWMRWAGLDISLVQPALLPVSGSPREEVATKGWCRIMPWEKGVMGLGWWDLDGNPQVDVNGSGNVDGAGEHIAQGKGHWWPSWGRWRFGACIYDADVVFEEGVRWGA